MSLYSLLDKPGLVGNLQFATGRYMYIRYWIWCYINRCSTLSDVSIIFSRISQYGLKHNLASGDTRAVSLTDSCQSAAATFSQMRRAYVQRTVAERSDGQSAWRHQHGHGDADFMTAASTTAANVTWDCQQANRAECYTQEEASTLARQCDRVGAPHVIKWRADVIQRPRW